MPIFDRCKSLTQIAWPPRCCRTQSGARSDFAGRGYKLTRLTGFDDFQAGIIEDLIPVVVVGRGDDGVSSFQQGTGTPGLDEARAMPPMIISRKDDVAHCVPRLSSIPYYWYGLTIEDSSRQRSQAARLPRYSRDCRLRFDLSDENQTSSAAGLPIASLASARASAIRLRLTGLERYSFMPASRQRCRSSTNALAVIAIM